MKGILKIGFADNFTRVPNSVLANKELTWKDKGIFSYMLSKVGISDWQFYLKDIENQSKDGRESVASSVKNLQERGYLKIENVRDSKGMITHKDWTLLLPETPAPISSQPDNGKPVLRETRLTVKPSYGKPAPNKKEYNNTEYKKKESSNKEIDKTEFLSYMKESGKVDNYANALYNRLKANNFSNKDGEFIENWKSYVNSILKNDYDIGNAQTREDELKEAETRVAQYSRTYLTDTNLALSVYISEQDGTRRKKDLHRYLKLIEKL